MFEVPMNKFIDTQNELVVVGDEINWNSLENNFKAYYSNRGRPAVPVRKIVGLLILKTRFQLSDEKVLNIWLENPYWQYFCGEVHFQKEKPFSSGEFSRFKRRVGGDGMDQIQYLSAEHFGEGENGTYKNYTFLKTRSFWQRLFNN